MVIAASSTLQAMTQAIDVHDQAGKQLIWKGTATKTLSPTKDPDKKQKNLDKAVAKLLRNYPSPKKKCGYFLSREHKSEFRSKS
jgi:hypothetical protein